MAVVLVLSPGAPADIHEEASAKTGARRSRDYPDIHSASSAGAERHEILRSLPFTPTASRRAMSDLGMQPESRSRSRRGGLLLAVPTGLGPESEWRIGRVSSEYQTVSMNNSLGGTERG